MRVPGRTGLAAGPPIPVGTVGGEVGALDGQRIAALAPATRTTPTPAQSLFIQVSLRPAERMDADCRRRVIKPSCATPDYRHFEAGCRTDVARFGFL